MAAAPEPAPPPAEAPAAPGPALVRAACLAGLALLGAVNLARFGQSAWWYLASPHALDYGEGCVLGLVQLLVERGTYFLPVSDYPYVHGIYPPVFLLLVAPFQRLLGPSLLWPRLLSLLSTAAAAGALFALVRQRTGQRGLALACASLLPAPWFVLSFAPLARIDMLALFFSLLGLLDHARLCGRGEERRLRPWLWFVLGFFTKQTALLAPAAVVLGLLLDPAGRRRAPRAVLLWLGPTLGVLAVLALATQGEAWRHLFPYTAAADYSVPALVRNARAFLILSGPLAALALFAAAGEARQWRSPDAALLAYWVLNLGALATFAKAGAAQNYFIEPWAATLVVAGSALARLGPAWPGFALGAGLVASVTNGEAWKPPEGIRPGPQAEEVAQVSRRIAATTGPVLSENLSLLVLNRRPVLVEPFGMLLLQRNGYWRSDRLVADCRARRFPLVVYEHRLKEIAGLGACLEEAYELSERLGPYELLVPRP